MSKRDRRVPKIAKLTGPNGTLVVDVESGMLVAVSNDLDAQRISTRAYPAPEHRSPPPGSPSSKLSRN